MFHAFTPRARGLRLAGATILFLGGALGLLTTHAGCGNGDGTPTPTPAPTLTSVAPGQGTSLGGTGLTLTGTDFLAGATVAVGTSAATGVTVVDASTITCTTPAGTAGATVGVSVSTAGGTATLPNAFTYHPLPTLTTVAPNLGTGSGGTNVTLTGTGFVANGAGANAVTIGGAPATAVVTVNDTTITCTTPPGAGGPADVAVANANGTTMLAGAFTYITPLLYAAESKQVSGNLYRIDPATAAATVVGPIGFPVTAMAFSADASILYGVTGGGLNSATFPPPQQLLTIDTTTGAGTIVGPIVDTVPVDVQIGDLDVRNGEVLGIGYSPQGLWRINAATGLATQIGPLVANLPARCGLASDLPGTLYWLQSQGFGDSLHVVDATAGTSTPVATITPAGSGFGRCAATFLDGVLYYCDNQAGTGSPSDLYTLDPATAAGTLVGALPVNIDALAGTVK